MRTLSQERNDTPFNTCSPWQENENWISENDNGWSHIFEGCFAAFSEYYGVSAQDAKWDKLGLRGYRRPFHFTVNKLRNTQFKIKPWEKDKEVFRRSLRNKYFSEKTKLQVYMNRCWISSREIKIDRRYKWRYSMMLIDKIYKMNLTSLIIEDYYKLKLVGRAGEVLESIVRLIPHKPITTDDMTDTILEKNGYSELTMSHFNSQVYGMIGAPSNVSNEI